MPESLETPANSSYPTLRAWAPPRVADLRLLPSDLAIFSDNDGGRSNYYAWYRWLTMQVKPRVVCEIGVRLGYSAWSLFCPGVTNVFIGFDNQSYVPDSNAQARRSLDPLYPTVILHALDTQATTDLQPFLHGHRPDLFHIDGDHSVAGCLHDLLLVHRVLPIGGTVIVDDADFGKEPAHACQEFLSRSPHYARITLDEAFSFRGHQILVRLA